MMGLPSPGPADNDGRTEETSKRVCQSRCLSAVPDISRYVSEGLFSSVSPRIFPGGNAQAPSQDRDARSVLSTQLIRYHG